MSLNILTGISLCLVIFLTNVFAAASAPPFPTSPPLTTVTENKERKLILGDSIGKTLYVFDQDQNEKAPVCIDKCAELWPPYILTLDEVASLQPPLGHIERTNGHKQLTYNGRPVYTYAFDRVQGDDLGDSLGGGAGEWHHIITP